MHAAPILVSPVSVCKTCGVVAPANGTTCEVCRAPLTGVRVSAPVLSGDQYWAAVRAAFTCNSCRFLAPLDSLDVDGAVECAHCGLRQRFDVHDWQPALELTHAVADLAGPNPEGRSPHPTIWIGSDNPHAAIGDRTTFAQTTVNALSFSAAPGHPVCTQCKELLQTRLMAPGNCETWCPRCQDHGKFQLSDAARHLYEGVLACISVECRGDRPRVRLDASAAGITLSCPSCGAPLTVQGSSTVQTCGYCRTSVLVPHRSLSRALHTAIEPSIWWLLFAGASPKRSELLIGEAAEADTSAKAALKLLKNRGPKDIGTAPGVYEAPEATGFNVPQMLLTVVLGGIALLIAFVLTRFVEF